MGDKEQKKVNEKEKDKQITEKLLKQVELEMEKEKK